MSDKHYAVLIDADNVSAKYASSIIAEISKYGRPIIKRIYGDWGRAPAWKQSLSEHALSPVQQFGNTKDKNATDIALVIDAMDILYTQKVTGFCIVASDSDYTKLAIRLREAGMHVIGMGEKKTPDSLRKSCDTFIILENTIKEEIHEEEESAKNTAKKPQTRTSAAAKTRKKLEPSIIALMKKFIEEGAEEEHGWTKMSKVAARIDITLPDFDTRNYGYTKFNQLIEAHSRSFEIKYEKEFFVKIR